ncbi:Flagellar P-ring protein FlgI [hydrothermal vent metagenome]|uniref:Flagellar P-ring protein FlgI n=1 Tax=hydrothermal vent metagenome TaxID=652676 RepID=A0A3B1DEB0_9ZZZZ
MKTQTYQAKFACIGVIALLLLGTPVAMQQQAEGARTRLENICTLDGQREVKLTGLGLVVGLNKTGDGGKNLPAMKALATALKLMNSPVLGLDELRGADNVAIVMIEATVPATGIRRGQKIDCYVSSFLGAKSLRGGRLLATPLEETDISTDRVAGIASGAIRIEGDKVFTTGKIPNGVVIENNFINGFLNAKKGGIITLMVDSHKASFHTASEVAYSVNSEFGFESGKEIAKATGPNSVEVHIPKAYKNDAVKFAARLLDIGIDMPHTQARVVVNATTGVVIVTGEVRIDPVVISHDKLTIEVGGSGGATSGGRFVSVPQLPQESGQSGSQLQELVRALKQLRVPNKEVVHIIRELHRSGKLHAVYDEH